MIVKKLEVGAIGSNCYIVGSEQAKEGIIIDPGDEADRILAEVKKAGLKIILIVATHGHFDHIIALKQVKDALKCDFAMHDGDAKGMDRIPREILAMFGMTHFTAPKPERLLKDGDPINFGDVRMTVLHTPGHTPGSICLPFGDVLLVGDTIFAGGAVGRTDFSYSSRSELETSIKKILAIPKETKLLSGHGESVTIEIWQSEYEK